MLLAQLSQSTHGPPCPSSSSSVHNFKRLLLRNRLTNQSQILYSAFLGRGTKVYINGPGHMTKMAATPFLVKTFENLILQNRKSYDLETWHVASKI